MPKAKYEEKFIVINRKHINNLNLKASHGLVHKHVQEFDMALTTLLLSIERNTGVYIGNNKYFVCNQDEPYAQKVIDTILKGESEKT